MPYAGDWIADMSDQKDVPGPRVQVMDGGVLKTGILVGIKEQDMAKGQVLLADGTTIGLGLSLNQVVLIEGETDAQGNPKYVLSVDGTCTITPARGRKPQH